MTRYKKMFCEYVLMTLASLVYAMGIAMFLDPNHLAPGGVTGISIILSNFAPLETGTIIFLFNVPLVILGVFKLGRKLMWRTLYCVTLTSVIIDAINTYYGRALTDDKIISALAGGSLVAVGVGVIMKHGGTTGGTDIIVRILRRRFPHIKTNIIYAIIDGTIVAISAIVFRDAVVAMYALVAVVVSNFVLDKVLYGSDEARMLYIISDHSQAIVDRLMHELDIGVTFIEGRGAYSGKKKEVILAVMRKQLSPKVEEVVKEIDPASFMIVTSASEIYGKGYKNIFSEKL